MKFLVGLLVSAAMGLCSCVSKSIKAPMPSKVYYQLDSATQVEKGIDSSLARSIVLKYGISEPPKDWKIGLLIERDTSSVFKRYRLEIGGSNTKQKGVFTCQEIWVDDLGNGIFQEVSRSTCWVD